MKKAVCIKNEDSIYNVIVGREALCIGRIYTIRILNINFVYVFKDNGEMGIYLKSNFRFIEDYRQERVNEIMNGKSCMY